MLTSKLSPHLGPRCHVGVARRQAGFRRPLTVARVVADPAAAGSEEAVSSAVAVLKEAARHASVAPKQVLQAMIEVEKQKLPCDDCVDYLTRPGSRWKLVYTIKPAAVVAAYKGETVSGTYFPVPAVWKFDSNPSIITYGIFLGSLAYMLFAGPFDTKNQKKVEYDLTFMTLGIGPFKATIPLRKDGALVDTLAKANGNENLLKKTLPFLLCAYADEEILVARGASGGVSLWVASDSEWQAKSGVMRVMQ